MKIMREKPCQRRHHRLSAPLYVSIEGEEPLLANDWSLSGLCIHDCPHTDYEIPSEISLTLDLPFQGYDISFKATAKVIRVEQATGTLFLEFTDLSERSFDLMNHFADDLIRGKMATIDDMICRIDVPVTPISTSPTPNPSEEIPINRLPLKTIFMTALYIGFGIFIFAYLGSIIYSNFVKMEIQTSVVTPKIHTLRMPAEGVIKPVAYKVGTQFNKGDEIFRIENTALLQKINSSKMRVQSAENKLTQAKEIYHIEQERMKLYQLVSETDVKVLKAQIASKKQELNAADDNFVRHHILGKLDSASQKEVDDAKQQQTTVAYQLEALQAKYAQAVAMKTVAERRHYNHKEFSVDLEMEAVKLQTLYQNVLLENKKLEMLVTQLASQVVRAPYKGIITNWFQEGNSVVSKNEPILMIQSLENITVSSYLTQDEVLHVGLFDEASVFIPALNIEMPAVVNRIDRSSAFIDKKNASYDWHSPTERTALVVLMLQTNPQTQALLNSGLPAVVIFKKRSKNYMFSQAIPSNSASLIQSSPNLQTKKPSIKNVLINQTYGGSHDSI